MKIEELEKDLKIIKKLLFEKGIILKKDFDYLKDNPYIRTKNGLKKLRKVYLK